MQDITAKELIRAKNTHQKCFENTIKLYEEQYSCKWGKDLQTFIDGISPGDKYSVKQALKPLQDNYKKAKKELINHCTKDTVYNEFIDKLEKDKELDLPDILIDCFKQTIEPESVSALLNIEKTKKLQAGNTFNNSIELFTSAGNSSQLAEKASSIADNQADNLLNASDDSKKESRGTSSKLSVNVKSAHQTLVGDSYDYSTKVTEMTKTIDSTSNLNTEKDESQARLVTQQEGSLFHNPQVTSSITKTSLPMPKSVKRKLVEEAYNLLHKEYDQTDIQENEQLQLWEKLLLNYKQKDGGLEVVQVAEVKDIINELKGQEASLEYQIDVPHKGHAFMGK